MPKLMIDGIWRGDVISRDAPAIEPGAFRGALTDENPKPGRYHLFVSYACPFAHRVLLVHALKKLDGIVGLSVLHPRWNHSDGWVFADTPLSSVDRSGSGLTRLFEAYAASDPTYTGRVTVPVLWDRCKRRIVSNESRDIAVMLNRAFDDAGAEAAIDLRPDGLAAEVDTLSLRIATDIATGVYRLGAAVDQAAYDAAADALFGLMGTLETGLADGRAFLHGDSPTLSDVLLFTPLIRFDPVYNPLFRASRRRLADHPALAAWTQRFLALPGVAGTVRFDHILRHYHDGDWGVANRRDIVPDLPHPLSRWTQPAGGRPERLGAPSVAAVTA